jgi:hypothetical protein
MAKEGLRQLSQQIWQTQNLTQGDHVGTEYSSFPATDKRKFAKRTPGLLSPTKFKKQPRNPRPRKGPTNLGPESQILANSASSTTSTESDEILPGLSKKPKPGPSPETIDIIDDEVSISKKPPPETIDMLADEFKSPPSTPPDSNKKKTS